MKHSGQSNIRITEVSNQNAQPMCLFLEINLEITESVFKLTYNSDFFTSQCIDLKNYFTLRKKIETIPCNLVLIKRKLTYKKY